MIVGHALARLESLPGTVPALHDLPREVKILVPGVFVPVRGLGGRVTGLASRALVPRTVRGLVDEGALALTRHAPLLPVCGLGGPGRGLWTVAGPVGFARTLGVTVRCLDDCASVRLAVTRPGVTGHTGPATGRVTVRPFPLTVHGLGKEVGGLGGVAGIVQR